LAIIAEMTATPRTAIFRFWFPPGEPANITVDAALGISYIQRQGDLKVVGTDEIEGSAGFGLFCTEPGGGRHPQSTNE
jgi:putative alpha-1,2-mannosidase